MDSDEHLLAVQNLTVQFRNESDCAVDQLSLSLAAGETLALVGESGCGKSTTALALMGLLAREASVSGSVRLQGRELIGLNPRQWRTMRGRRMGMVFQDATAALNPVRTLGDQIGEGLGAHFGLSSRVAHRRTLELLDLVELPDPKSKFYAFPHEISGGQRQRAMIAAAIACSPSVLLADEPTTALDAPLRHQILALLDRLKTELSMGMILITHDLALVKRWADRVLVMHHGQKMDELRPDQLQDVDRHPYTRGLGEASLTFDAACHYRDNRLAEIKVKRSENQSYVFSVTNPPHRIWREKQDVEKAPLLEVANLGVSYGRGRKRFTALEGVSLTVRAGETIGLLGESGSGKTTLSKAILGLLRPSTGSISIDGQHEVDSRSSRKEFLRRTVQMVFQDPNGSLNPRQSVGDILHYALAAAGEADASKREREALVMLDRVGLSPKSLRRYPHEFSGGQKQRIGIARALLMKPRLLICDEPVSALDVSVQAQVLNLLTDLREEFNLSYLFISHDLAVVRYVSDRVVVLKGGRIVETGEQQRIWSEPQHAYTQALISAA